VITPLLLTAATALAASVAGPEPSEEPRARHSAVLFDPSGPTIAAVATLLGNPALDLNLRGHHMFGDRLGLTVEADWLSITQMYTLKARHAGLRAGPRVALRGRGLDDWALLPFGLFGHTDLSATGVGAMGTYGVLGAGAELSRLWNRGPVAFEVGLGLHASASVGYRVHSPSLEGTDLAPGPRLRPLMDLGVGYAW
jgi:hypothetical protein